MPDVHSLLCLSAIPGLGPLRLRSLMNHFKDPAAILRANPRELVRVPGITHTTARAIYHHSGGTRFADDQLSRAHTLGATIVTYWDDHYPELLRKIYDPPPLLFLRGAFTAPDRYALAMVGTRKPSPYGTRAAEHITKALVESGLTIVSGLARGIDTAAHVSALNNGGRTIAVIGCGVDVAYPPENRDLMERIISSGAVVSEFPFGTRPDGSHFPRRNRIISGLSLGTIIAESPEDGGAMITAAMALDQNREVFAVPGNIFEKRSAGPHFLIRNSQAKLVHTVEDIFEELEIPLGRFRQRSPERPPLPPLSLFENTILELLGEEPVHIDFLAERAHLSPADTLVSLLSLEFKGLVRQLAGRMFVRTDF